MVVGSGSQGASARSQSRQWGSPTSNRLMTLNRPDRNTAAPSVLENEPRTGPGCKPDVPGVRREAANERAGGPDRTAVAPAAARSGLRSPPLGSRRGRNRVVPAPSALRADRQEGPLARTRGVALPNVQRIGLERVAAAQAFAGEIDHAQESEVGGLPQPVGRRNRGTEAGMYPLQPGSEVRRVSRRFARLHPVRFRYSREVFRRRRNALFPAGRGSTPRSRSVFPGSIPAPYGVGITCSAVGFPIDP